jgi:hypothetical protein
MLADRFELDSLGFLIEKLETAHSTSPYGKVHGQVGRRFARPIAERVTMLHGVERFCPTPCTRPLLLDRLKRSG